jgi:hypothetical protein
MMKDTKPDRVIVAVKYKAFLANRNIVVCITIIPNNINDRIYAFYGKSLISWHFTGASVYDQKGGEIC